ncbi:hypothetical protein COCNU_11G006120 [Cocos nucifera]|uniref:Uncharacterized protein n=1 Tax=Cocos nucifera TaxID=13894 RepID=A0A8K0N9Z6_COCNU|nr:hypothetical protein COCNU_11G006120 [Cocos nucifera]
MHQTSPVDPRSLVRHHNIHLDTILSPLACSLITVSESFKTHPGLPVTNPYPIKKCIEVQPPNGHEPSSKLSLVCPSSIATITIPCHSFPLRLEPSMILFSPQTEQLFAFRVPLVKWRGLWRIKSSRPEAQRWII